MAMLTDTGLPSTAPVVNALQASRFPLQRVVDSGLLRCAVPRDLGGNGGGLDDLAHAAGLLQRQDPAAAAVLWAQRLAIEALVQTANVGLREFWLPDFLNGDRAATLAPGGKELTAEDTGRGWLLSGVFHGVPNLPWEGFSLVAPVRLGDGNAGWVLLRSEEDGLSVHPAAPGHAHASLHLNRVFFREDEWLGEQHMAQRLAPVAEALAPCRPRPPALNT
jgi:alkylation response protein AidB-like acyl-CoA dehydrogenase